MTAEQFAACLLIAIAIGSRWLYRHDANVYRKHKQPQPDAPRRFRWVYAWVRYSTALMGIGALLSDHAIWFVAYRDPLCLMIGMALAVIGFLLFAWAKVCLGRHYSPCFDVWVPTGVVQHGPYRLVRHPIYTANLLLLAGLGVATGSAWLWFNVTLVMIYYVPSALREERALQTAHPEYAAYMQRTGRFVPRLRATEA